MLINWSPASNNNINGSGNENNIIYTIKDTELYAPVVTLSARDNQKLSKCLVLVKALKDQFIRINIKKKKKREKQCDK